MQKALTSFFQSKTPIKTSGQLRDLNPSKTRAFGDSAASSNVKRAYTTTGGTSAEQTEESKFAHRTGKRMAPFKDAADSDDEPLASRKKLNRKKRVVKDESDEDYQEPVSASDGESGESQFSYFSESSIASNPMARNKKKSPPATAPPKNAKQGPQKIQISAPNKRQSAPA